MIKIKVCGITRREDAFSLAGLGVDFLGFIFYPKSPRYIKPARAAAIIRQLKDGRIRKVGVFVNEPAETINRTVKECGLDLVQLHDLNSPAFYASIQVPVIKVFNVEQASDLEGIEEFDKTVKYYLFDAKLKGLHGGIGRSFDWDLLRKKSVQKEFFLAGGLNENNIVSACGIRPFAVDLNSGVEVAPGTKDPRVVARIMSLVEGFR